MALTNGMDALKAILGCVQAEGSQVAHAILEEKQQGAKLRKLTISDLGPGMLLLATDEGRKRNQAPACMSPLFAEDGLYDQNRACDAVLFRQTEEGYQVCYIELKSDNPSGFEGQFISTQCFISYVCELSERLCNHSINIIRERYVVFHTDTKNGVRRGLKTKTLFVPRSANAPKSPDMFCVRNGDTVRFSEFF